MAVITWGDADGTWAIRSGNPTPGDRFQGWTPVTRPVGETAVALGTGLTTMFVYRRDYGATFRLEGILGDRRALTAAGTLRAESMLDACDRLIERLVEGGAVNVWPENGVAPSLRYQCVIRAGAEPTVSLGDRARLDYTLELSMLTLDGTRMVFPYGVATAGATGASVPTP